MTETEGVQGRRSAALPSHEITPAVKVKTESKEKIKQVRKTPLTDDPNAPTRGLPALSHQTKYWTSRAVSEVGIRYTPKETIPNAFERRERADAKLCALKEELYALIVAAKQHRIIVWLNSKGGGGKTPGSTVSSCVISWATRGEQILLVDANESTGTTADRMGVSSRTTLKRVVGMEHLSNSEMTDLLPRHADYNVRVIASDQAAATYIRTDDFMKFMGMLMQNVTSTVIDTGNGISYANMGGARLADALVFPALWEDQSIQGSVNASMKSLASTMNEYAKQGLEEKVRRAFIVVSRVREAKTEKEALQIKQEVWDTLEHHFNMVDDLDSEVETGEERKMSLADHGMTIDQLIVVPTSKHIASGLPVDLDVDTIGINTLIAYLELLVAIYKQPVLNAMPEPSKEALAPVNALHSIDSFDDVPSYLPEGSGHFPQHVTRTPAYPQQ
ncbi:MAG: chromosome partitioning ATPase [Candidatus Saccharibacteria bacterium]|nr:chromosome partitioning ATPase [Candidatus Saccharibacteria bacterium]